MAASSTGTSHLAKGAGCDDAGACIEVLAGNEPTLIAVVSDGAGSARLSRMGSRIVARAFCRSAIRFARDGHCPRDLTKELASDWLDDARDRIENASVRLNSPRQSFAATLVGCVIQRTGIAILHVGDGACVVRLRGDDHWQVPSWPFQGEFAATTRFVTDDPEPTSDLVYIDGQIAEVAVFTDGIERLALDFAEKTAFTPFFASMFRGVPLDSKGRIKELSRALGIFLASQKVNDRTDDDKTLILAKIN